MRPSPAHVLTIGLPAGGRDCRKRVFIVGPSHHFYLAGCALSQCSAYETPLGRLAVDTATVAELHATGAFDRMSQAVDEAEHSLEMHLPHLYWALQA